MKLLRHALAGLMFSLVGTTLDAHAVALFYPFQIDFVAGPLSGQTVVGSLGIEGGNDDCFIGGCNGGFTPNDPKRTLLSFNITVGGTRFSMNDDLRFPGFPRAASYAGSVPTINYSGQAGPAGGESELIILPNGSVSFSPGSSFEPDRSLGLLVFPQAVPEASTLSLFGLGVGLLAYVGSKRRRAAGALPLRADRRPAD